MNRTFLSLFLLMQAVYILAIPAYNKKITIDIDGETVYITLKGDENCKYAIDEYGYTLLPTEKGWFYAAEQDGMIVCSKFKLQPINRQTNQTKEFLKSAKKGVKPFAEETEMRFSHNLSRSQSASIKPAVGLRKVLIILMQYQDTKLTKSVNDFQQLFNQEGYQEDGAVGSVRDYYKWASYGKLELQSDVVGPYTAHYRMSYYGGNQGVSGGDANPYELFLEAIGQAAQDVNLSDYDSDGDGYVDNVHIIYAGYGEEAGASANAIWAHESTFRTITVQGMKIDRYSCAPELRDNKGGGISRIGPHCHEIGHALGAMDFYDTDYETGGQYLGTGKWDIMASGSWNNDGITPADFNPYVKIYNFGWTTAQTLKNDTINKIAPSTDEGNIYRINTGISNDYFLLENRDGEKFNSAEPGSGLVIFHIGPNLESRSSANTINSTYPQQCYVVCASSSAKKPTSSASSYGNINSGGCPYPGSSGNTEFSSLSTPAALTVSGKEAGISISNIQHDGTDIVFLYGSINSEDTPDDSSTPDVSYLWAEDFEQLRLPSNWNYIDVEGTGEFIVSSKMSTNDQPQSPVAASGVGYAKFSAIPRMVIGEYRTIGSVVSPRIRLAEGKKYILSISVRKYNKKGMDSSDILSISLIKEDGSEDSLVVKKDVNNQNSWEKVSLSLPESEYDFSIKVTCDIDYGTALFIDNINISEKSEETSIGHVKTADQVRLFNASGSCIYEGKADETIPVGIHLTKGFYILCYSNGISKKIIIK